MFNEPVNQLFCNKAVWVGFEMVPSIFNNLFFMEPQLSGGESEGRMAAAVQLGRSLHRAFPASVPAAWLKLLASGLQ